MYKITCPCGKEVEFEAKSKLGRKKYCSKKCFYKYRKIEIWNKGLKGIHLSPNSEFKKGMIPWNSGTKGLMKANYGSIKKGERRSKRTEFKKGDKTWNKDKKFIQFQNENHPNWKGDNVEYSALHTWVIRKFGQPDTCEHCGKSDLKNHKIHWANINHKYRRNREDWVRLCAKCHINYDKKFNKNKK